jgi:hypothetical protein
MRLLCHVVTPLLALGCAVTVACAQWGPPPKKLIEYGWDVPYPDFVRQHTREMEQRPFDGLIFRLRDYNLAFDVRPWREEDLAPQLADLQGIEWRTFTDNFLCIYAAADSGMDWFNDEHWQAISHNLRLTARAARLGGCVGICFDPEPYGRNPWEYSGGPRPFAEVAAQVRKRGAEFITALQEELPILRLLTFFQLAIAGDLVDERDPKRLEERLSQNGYGLLPAFLNGMLDAIAPGVRIIDGNENAYYYTNADSYFRAYHYMKQRALSLIAPENRDEYVAQVQAGMALYIDQVMALRPPAGEFLCYYMTPEERAAWFQHNVYYALTTTDEYVWCYSERMNWWQKQDIPPGAEQAIRSARREVADGRPLGFDISDMIAAAQSKWDEGVAARTIKRTAGIRQLAGNEPAPRIDGILDDAVWRDHQPLEHFLPPAAPNKDRPEAQTTAWVTFDDQNLYLAFRCQEPNPQQLKIVGEKRDDDIWEGDDVELFFSLGEKPVPYRHFIVNPAGLQFDEEATAEGDDHEFDAEWLSQAHVGDAEWTVEIAIPWQALGGKPRPGESRRANLCRQRCPVPELSAWSSIVRYFVEPDHFGVWVFAD